MELKEYYKIIRVNFSVVVYVVIISIIATYVWSIKISRDYSASMIFDISRAEAQTTTYYQYDQFYELQANEKFAENIVEWLKTPGIAKDIFEKAGIVSDQKTMRQLSKSFQAEKVSSNLIRLQYSAQTREEAEKIAPAAEKVISEKTKKMNIDANASNWFQISSSNLIILQNIQNLWINLSVAAATGFFLGILFAFGKHYIFLE